MANAGNIASREAANRNGFVNNNFTALPESLEPLADSIALPWRDAGARSRKSVKVSPHKCQRMIRNTKIRGKYVRVEYRH